MKYRNIICFLSLLLLCSCSSKSYFINQKSYVEESSLDVVKVAFSYGNGEEDSYENLEKGDTLSEIKVPKRTGYQFLGWYLNDSPWDFKKDKVYTDMTLTANWIGEKDRTKKHATLRGEDSSFTLDFEFYENNTAKQISSFLEKEDIDFLSTDSFTLKATHLDSILTEDETQTLLPLEIGMKDGKELFFPFTKQQSTWTPVGRIVSKSLVDARKELSELKKDTSLTLSRSENN